MNERLDDRSNLDRLHELQQQLNSAESELIKRDALLAAIVNSAADAVIARDLEGNIIAWNPAAERMFGYSSEEMMGQSIYKIIPPERREEHQNWVNAIRRGESVAPFETERLHKNGEKIRVFVSVSPIIARNGEVLGASAIDHEVNGE